MEGFQTIARVGEIAEGQGRAFVVGTRIVAVFRQGDEYFAIDDTCPHMGASLADGQMCDGSVVCGWHAWRFSIKDGTWLDNPRLKIDTFEVRVEGEEIQVRGASSGNREESRTD